MRNHQKWEEIQEKCDRGFKNWKLGEGRKTCESLGGGERLASMTIMRVCTTMSIMKRISQFAVEELD